MFTDRGLDARPDGVKRAAELCPHGIALRPTFENDNAGRGSDVAGVVGGPSHAAARAPSRRLSHSAIWFQLVKIWLTILPEQFFEFWRRRLVAERL